MNATFTIQHPKPEWPGTGVCSEISGNEKKNPGGIDRRGGGVEIEGGGLLVLFGSGKVGVKPGFSLIPTVGLDDPVRSLLLCCIAGDGMADHYFGIGFSIPECHHESGFGVLVGRMGQSGFRMEPDRISQRCLGFGTE